MQLTRRQFIKWVGAAGAAVGLSETMIATLAGNMSQALGALGGGARVVWLRGQSCSGCVTSVAGTFMHYEVIDRAIDGGLIAPPGGLDKTLDILLGAGNGQDGHTTIDDVVLDFIDLGFEHTIMGPASELAMKVLEQPAAAVVMEGAIPTNNPKYAEVGTDVTGHFGGVGLPVFVGDVLNHFVTTHSTPVVAIGQCATFGGIPAARSDDRYRRNKGGYIGTTGARGTQAYLPTATVVNCPGCPPHPEWVVLTVAHILATSTIPPLDNYSRPKRVLTGVGPLTNGIKLYEETVHWNCPRYPDYVAGKFQSELGTKVAGSAAGGCLRLLGCKGPDTFSACGQLGWNASNEILDVTGDTDAAWLNGWNSNKPSFCVTGEHPCIGCTEKGYPDKFSPFVNY